MNLSLLAKCKGEIKSLCAMSAGAALVKLVAYHALKGGSRVRKELCSVAVVVCTHDGCRDVGGACNVSVAVNKCVFHKIASIFIVRVIDCRLWFAR